MRRIRARSVVLLLLALTGGAWWLGSDLLGGRVPPNYQPTDATLRSVPLSFYRSPHPRALIWFFGNDVGFWGPQTRLAARLAAAGYDVVGFDWSRWARRDASEPPTARARRFAREIGDWEQRAAHELGDDTLPLLLAGHSVGAEVALWQAAEAPPARLEGVIAISPGSRGHLYVTASDLALGEPTERGSFAVDSLIGHLPIALPVTVVRGSNDPLRGVDSLIQRQRPSVHFVPIPLAGHSLKRLVLAGPLIERAVDWTMHHETGGSLHLPLVASPSSH